MIRLKIMVWVDYPGLRKFTQCKHMGLYERGEGGSESRQYDGGSIG